MSFKLSLDQFNRYTEQSQQSISAKILADSIAPNECRLTTMEWTYPRFIHSEIMTHRKLSRNSASSRAIPLSKMIERVSMNPVFPLHWGKNQKGMQADEELDFEQKLDAAGNWIRARDLMIERARALEHIGIHKQLGNRLLEPWMWITVIVSATNFENLFTLRCHKDAEPHFQNLSYKVRDVLDRSIPERLEWGEWHLPLIGFDGDNEISEEDLPKVSTGRCARVSYLTHEGKRDPSKDIELYERLATAKPLHSSPLEHPAQATCPQKEAYPYVNIDWGNFDPGWLQFRKMHKDEFITTRETV